MANRLNCFTCNGRFLARTMARIDGEDDAVKVEIATNRRNALNLPPLDITDRTRLCINCNRSIIEEKEAVERDPDCSRLNVLTQTNNGTCVICNAANDIHCLSVESRANIFLSAGIYVPKLVKSCRVHLDDRGYLLSHLVLGLRFIYRPYQLKGQQLQMLLQGLRVAAVNLVKIEDETCFTDEEFENYFPVTKEQFQELYNYCDSVPLIGGGQRHVYKKYLLVFLCKLRQGLSDTFLCSMFKYSSRQAVSMAIATVGQSLMKTFVRKNIGFDAISREDFITRHVTEFANVPYNEEPYIRRAIAIIDGTYTYIHKSTNFQALRQSFSIHKRDHLVKPHLLVAPDGYILDIQGPYFSDSENNDAAILMNEFRDDPMRQWFQENGIVIVDRGYRDVTQFLNRLGIVHKMPAFLERGEYQLSTEDGNASRLVTKQRWVVEARNGHLKSIFKFLANEVQIQHAPNIGDFYRIAGAIINRYREPLIMSDANAELAQRLREKLREPNFVKRLVEEENLRNRIAQRWVQLNEAQFNGFPILTIEYLKQFTVGTYQIKLSPSYIQDKLIRNDGDGFTIEMLRNQNRLPRPGLIRVKIKSRFRRAKTHQLWITYVPTDEEDDRMEEDFNPIQGHYCTCKSGARTIGCCAHIASVLWYLGYARHNENVRYPYTKLALKMKNARRRPA